MLLTLLFSCSESPLDDVNMGEEIKVGEEVESGRIVLVNQKVTVTTNSSSQGGTANFSEPLGSAEDQQYSCDRTISEDTNGEKIDKGEIVCLAAGVTLSGNVQMKGGTLVIYGVANFSNINGNDGTIVIAEGGTFNLNNLNINNKFEILNYSSDFNVSSINVSGEFKNYADLELNQINLNGGGKMENYGSLTITSNFQINSEFVNRGTFITNSDLTVNGGGEFDNGCKVIVKGSLNINNDITSDGYIEVTNGTTINGGGKLYLAAGSYIKMASLTLNGTIEGQGDDYSRVDIAGRTVINGGGNVKKKIAFNDADGIEVNYGQFDSEVLLDELIEIAQTDCNPGAEAELIEPEYTLVADITVPQLLGSNLSATDVTHSNGLAFVSYHLNGNQYAGAIDVLDLSNPNAPAFTVNYTSESREFNALNVLDSKLFLAGQRDKEESGYTANSTDGALLYVVEVIQGDQLESSVDWQEIPMPSFSGNSVSVMGNHQLLFASGASGGGFFEVNTQSENITATQSENYAKYVKYADGVKYKLIGGNSNAQLIIESNGGSNTVDLGQPAAPVDGKNVVTVYDGKAYVTLGQNGLVVVNLESNEVVGSYNHDGPGLANGVAVDEDFVYLANGQSGLILLRRRTLEFYGQYKYEGSANLVDISGNIILIANGIGGVKLLLRDL